MNRKTALIIAAAGLMVGVVVLEFLLPDKALDINDNKYKVYWLMAGVAQVLLTILMSYLVISSSLKKSGFTKMAILEIIIWLCIAILWLDLTAKPAFKMYRRFSTGTVLKGVTDAGCRVPPSLTMADRRARHDNVDN